VARSLDFMEIRIAVLPGRQAARGNRIDRAGCRHAALGDNHLVKAKIEQHPEREREPGEESDRSKRRLLLGRSLSV